MGTPEHPSYIYFVSSSDDQDQCIYNNDINIDHTPTHTIHDYSNDNCSSDNVMLIQTVPLDYKNYQDDQEQEEKTKNELFAMKIKMEKQQEKINILSSKLYAVQSEKKEVLRQQQHKHQQENDICEDTCQDDKQNEEPGTKLLQFVIDTNAKLIADNVRLQGLVDVTRKSLTSIRRRRRRRSSSVSTRSDDSVNIMIDTPRQPQDVTKSSSVKTQDEDRDEKNDDEMIVDFGERRRLCRVSSTARMA